ncbi:MAG: biopolymer transporter ExbD [Pseudomonadales bacterium]|nr:biopolymer transporter ExbD [Halioglobus sp.]MCP5121148.1 biopolymer transporter ExbD [Pseudomonadales bacterium]MCP5193512.1 biopolymer transporter ExbD [Pseudomonadales bacterium]
MKRRRIHVCEAELDITAFMNLMIVLVPILLLGMVFSRITEIEVTLPPGATLDKLSAEQQQIELLIRADGMRLDYPGGVLLKQIPLTAPGAYDFEFLSLVLQEVKRQLREKGVEKKSITLLPAPDIDYQTIVTAVDTVRSFKAVVAASVVDAELFPDISFGDAPQPEAGGAG